MIIFLAGIFIAIFILFVCKGASESEDMLEQYYKELEEN